MSDRVFLNMGLHSVCIDKGELVSYQLDGHEFIHQKGNPGWGSSDTEMFPIIGPVNEAGFQVQVPKGSAVQDQHGLLRLIDYIKISATPTIAVFEKVYKAGTPVLNKKYPDKSPKKYLVWPYSFTFKKSFELKNNQLEIVFTIDGEHDMPFMLGYHPAFKLTTSSPRIQANGREIALSEILAVGSRALEVQKCQKITLLDEKKIMISTEGFEHFMCWTEVPNMVCIEPITFYPYSLGQQKLHEGFDYLHKLAVYKVAMAPKSE